MDFKVEGNAERLVVHVLGEVTAEGSNVLRETILDLTRTKPALIVLDLTEMPFIDTSGLGVLVGVRAQAKKQGTVIQLINAQSRVAHVLRITQLSKIFGMQL